MDYFCTVTVIYLTSPFCWVQGEAMRRLQVFSHQCYPTSSIKVTHVNALHPGLQHVEFEVDPVNCKILDALN